MTVKKAGNKRQVEQVDNDREEEKRNAIRVVSWTENVDEIIFNEWKRA